MKPRSSSVRLPAPRPDTCSAPPGARALAPDAPAPLQMQYPNATPFHAPCNRQPPGLEHLFDARIKKGAGYQHSRACIQPRACQPPTGNLCSYLAAHIAPRRTPCPLFQPWLLRHSQSPRPTLFDHDRDFSIARLSTHPPDLIHETANHLLGHGSILAHTFFCVNARNVSMNTCFMPNRKESKKRTDHIAGSVSGDSSQQIFLDSARRRVGQAHVLRWPERDDLCRAVVNPSVEVCMAVSPMIPKCIEDLCRSTRLKDRKLVWPKKLRGANLFAVQAEPCFLGCRMEH